MKRLTIFVLLLVGSAPAAEPPRLGPPLRVDRDNRAIAEPGEQQVSEIYSILYNSWLRHLSPENAAMASRDKGALNVNAWDDVPDSSWFTNRTSHRSLSFQDIIAGLEGASPENGTWIVERNVEEGYTPKFRIKDAAGRRYWVKFDLREAPERNSAAERISTLILFACGYNVPFNTIARFRGENLRVTSESRFVDAVGKQRPMTAKDLRAALERLKPQPDGMYRGLASYLLPDYLGKFKYNGTRGDDPSDIIPHERRRELRGLRVIASWINHADTGDKNTADAFVRTNGDTGYVKHYLLDFGSTLGSGNYTNGPYRVGHEHLFDGSAMGRTLITFGAWRRPWETMGRIRFVEVGYFDSELFRPERWRPNYPNLAFVRMDDGDAYWGARIVTAFSDETIEKLVEAGEYSRPEATRYVAETLKRRRDMIGRYWLNRVSPLEEFALDGDRLRFRDLAVDRGYVEAASRKYRCSVEDRAGRKSSEAAVLTGTSCQVPMALIRDTTRDKYGRMLMARVIIRSNRADNGWAAPVEVVLGRDKGASGISVLGWRHARRE